MARAGHSVRFRYDFPHYRAALFGVFRGPADARFTRRVADRRRFDQHDLHGRRGCLHMQIWTSGKCLEFEELCCLKTLSNF